MLITSLHAQSIARNRLRQVDLENSIRVDLLRFENGVVLVDERNRVCTRLAGSNQPTQGGAVALAARAKQGEGVAMLAAGQRFNSRSSAQPDVRSAKG